ncbi:Ribonuclease P-related [Methanococcus vannielii SB]|jgi:ribonuclease P/MRP protein subunit POP5|uniref:Ribonuclease P protein component 2 n=1 Tax=Methanococcus vannielii (strain ATCC 35089 / DSM 1224 / JCM 13029 / OCM 148 / SB) TaxID=406327 RepID=RNP2_METVS|nr:Rpp14/Pop5 family protein [Methanococcus vannielii]A6UN85.1 RecName: Full=Ribonuclease P protein component 2; Short=RNase P component 2; AltName: Full=Pop5 [Methanococcus vannielii SB]ABR53957.1 Ribonuclease P-related [Methanococcus vannielii SB]
MLKTLPPTLREKKRYVAFEIISESEFPQKEVVGIIRSAVLIYCGIHGCSKVNPWLIDYRHPSGILRVSREYLDLLRSSLMLFDEYKRNPINIRIIGVSNSVKHIREKFLHVSHEPYYKVIQKLKKRNLVK